MGGVRRGLTGPVVAGQQAESHSLGFRTSGSFLVSAELWGAERAGVPPGARLLEVNGVSVEKLTHNQLLMRKVWLLPLVLTPLGLSCLGKQALSLQSDVPPSPILPFPLCARPPPSPPREASFRAGKKGWEGVPASALPPQLVDA